MAAKQAQLNQGVLGDTTVKRSADVVATLQKPWSKQDVLDILNNKIKNEGGSREHHRLGRQQQEGHMAGQPQVHILAQAGRAEGVLRAVRLGAPRGAAGVEVLAGLKPGERVAADAVAAGLADAVPAP